VDINTIWAYGPQSSRSGRADSLILRFLKRLGISWTVKLRLPCQELRFLQLVCCRISPLSTNFYDKFHSKPSPLLVHAVICQVTPISD
jgi:hypothetical protein